MKAKNKDMLAAAGLTLACAGLVLTWPTMDLAVAGWFYRPGEGFFANAWWPIQAVYVGAPWLLQLTLAASALVLLLALVQPGKVARYWWRHALAWVLVVAFGVGLLVHNALKDQVGRPRPVHVQDFGGPAPYIPALQLSSHCDTNCSFVSGHAAGAFSIMAFGMLACRRRKLQWLWAGLLFGTLVGAVRMAQGGHFLSDVVFAALAVWWTYHLIGRLWIRCKAVLLHYRRKQLPGDRRPLP